MGLAAGDLNRRVRLERNTGTTRDALNAPVPVWTLIANRSASYEPLKDGERFRAAEVAAGASARFVIRWSSEVADLTAKDRLIFEGATHEILHVKEVGRREGIEITTAARADG